MNWAKPMGAATAPLVFLGLAACAILLDIFGLESALAGRLLAHYLAAAPGHGAAPPLAPLRLAELAWLLLFGGAALWLLRSGIVWAGLAGGAGAILSAWAGWIVFLRLDRLFDAASVSLALVALALVTVASGALWQWLARLRLRLAFGDGLPRAHAERIARHPELIQADGAVRDCSYLVCGVRGLADLDTVFHGDPAAFIRLRQQMLSPLMDLAQTHGGTIDRRTADGFTAFWNAPLDDPSHATHACEAAGGMAAMAAQVNRMLAERTMAGGTPLPALEIGVGVATGPVIAGGAGGQRLGYGVHGAAVTLAGRIQTLSHQYGPAVIVSDATRAAADRSFAFLEVDTVAAGAGGPPVTLFAILGNPVLKASPKFRALATFHDHIFQALRTRQWRQARSLVEQCRRLSGASPRLYDLYQARIGQYETSPPEENWDGTFRPVPK